MNEVIESIKSKIGDENSNLIVDDIASLITMENTHASNLQDKDKEISKLNETVDTLTKANANLLKQIPMIKDDEKEETKEIRENEHISLREQFDSKGNFIN